MAYLTKEKAKEIRTKLRAKFPTKDGWKISVVNLHLSVAAVTILEAPIRFSDSDYDQMNHFYPQKYQNPEVFQEIVDICMNGNHDNSDAQTDYFDVGWYLHLHQGSWDKPFKLNTIES